MNHALLAPGLAVATLASLATASEATSLSLERAYAAELLADAAVRQETKPTAGHDGRFFIASTDGNYRLNIAGEIQFRYYANLDANSTSDDYEGGFQSHRTRLEFRGHMVSPKLTYRILTIFDRATGNLGLQDAWGEYAFDNGIKLRWGQFKLPFDREFFATAPTHTQTIERSLISTIFRLDRSQGVQLSYEADRWRIFGAISDGRRAANTTFNDPIESDLGLTARAEFRLGEAGWRQYRDQTSFRGDKFGVLVGLGGHWQQDGATGAPTSAMGTIDLFQYTADIGVEGDGWNLLASATGRVFDSDGDSVHDLGFLVQGGVFLNDNAELFARYVHIMPDDDRTGGSDDFGAITAGLNWYFIPKSQALRLTAEVTFYPETQADSASLVRVPDNGVGLLGDTSGGQTTLGLQMQLMF